MSADILKQLGIIPEDAELIELDRIEVKDAESDDIMIEKTFEFIANTVKYNVKNNEKPKVKFVIETDYKLINVNVDIKDKEK